MVCIDLFNFECFILFYLFYLYLFYYIPDTGHKCWLHVGQSLPKENIIPFTDETLKHCVKKKELREKKKKKKSKYDIIVLPEKVDGISGYHASCYRYFCSIQEKAVNVDGLKGNAY